MYCSAAWLGHFNEPLQLLFNEYTKCPPRPAVDIGFSKSHFDGIWSPITDMEQILPTNALRFYPEQQTCGESWICIEIYVTISYFKENLHEMGSYL